MNNQKYLIAANWKQNGDAKTLIRLIFKNSLKLQKKNHLNHQMYKNYLKNKKRLLKLGEIKISSFNFKK